MGSSGGAGPLVPTFHGFVNNSMDGLVLFEACLSGKLHHVPRRPHDRERNSLIKSGSIFIYEENASGIKRWTDGVAWSPSRILGNFLIYRELEKPFPPGEKKRAMKRKRTSIPGEPYPRRDSDETEGPEQITPISPPSPNVSVDVKSELPGNDQDKELERSLIGSLVDSYGFRPDGLVKKTMSISINGISHHMVSYYKVEDVKNNVLPRPLSEPRLQGISVRPELYLKQNFRAPVEETEHYAIDGQMHAHPQMMYSAVPAGPYGVRPGQYFAGQPYQTMYGMATSTASPYGSMTGTSWGNQTPSTGALTYPTHPAYAGQGHYRTPSQSGVKAEDQSTTSQAMQYGSQYAPAYPGMQRHDSQSTPTMIQSAYHTPVQQSSSTFGSMSARPSYNSSTMTSPTANGQSQPQYGSALPPSYAVRSPQQGYGVQSAPSSAVPQSPHTNVKSPNSAAPAGASAQSMTATDSNAHLQHQHQQMPYRSGPYPPQSAHSADMTGLGISSTPGYSSQGQQGQSYPVYSVSGQEYKTVGSGITAAPSNGHYVQ